VLVGRVEGLQRVVHDPDHERHAEDLQRGRRGPGKDRGFSPFGQTFCRGAINFGMRAGNPRKIYTILSLLNIELIAVKIENGNYQSIIPMSLKPIDCSTSGFHLFYISSCVAGGLLTALAVWESSRRRGGIVMQESSQTTLYEQLGGQEAIDAVVEEFYARVLADEKVKDLFKNTDME